MNLTRSIEAKKQSELERAKKLFTENNRKRDEARAKIGSWIGEGEIKKKLLSENSSIVHEREPTSHYNNYNYRHGDQNNYRNYNVSDIPIYQEILLFCEIYKDKWVRPLSSWKSSSKNSIKDMKSLLRHLFVKYEFPKCLMIDIFNHKSSSRYRSMIMDWFVEIGGGANIRKFKKTPFTITKKTAHYFHNSPDNLNTEQAIRWGQIMALGGSKNISHNIAISRFGEIFSHQMFLGDENDHFWGTVFTFLINNTCITKEWYDRILDYLLYLKRQFPNTSMSKRTPDALIEQVLDFEKSSFKDKGAASNWKGMDLPVFEVFTEEKIPGNDGVKAEHRYTIREITSSTELKKESSALSHCVWSYSERCKSGSISIFSMEKDGKKCITIEVLRQGKRICQKAGKFNKPPTYNDNMVISKWAFENKMHDM